MDDIKIEWLRERLKWMIDRKNEWYKDWMNDIKIEWMI